MIKKLDKISFRFLKTLNLDDAYSIIIHEAINLSGGNFGSIYLAKGDNLEKVYASTPTLYKIVSRGKDSFAYKTFKYHKPYKLDIEQFGDKFPEIKKLGVKTSIFIPLSYQQYSIGTIIVQSLKKKELKKEDYRILKLFGSFASLTIKKAQFHEDTIKAVRMSKESKEMEQVLEKIYKAGLRFLEPLKLEETYATIVKEAMKLVNGQYGSIHIEKNDNLERVYASDSLLYKIKPRPKGHIYKVFKKRLSLILKTEEVISIHPEFAQLKKVKSALLIPLFYLNKSMGVLTVQSAKKRTFSKKDLTILKLFSPFATLAIRKAHLYNEAKKAVEIRDYFIALAAHELRTPLTALNGYVQLLYNKLEKKQSNEFQLVKYLSQESKRLTNLIQELLEINRIQTGKFHYVLEEINMKDILKKAVDNFSFISPKRKLFFKNGLVSRQAEIIGDFNKLVQVFNNLLDNAAKFSAPETPIILEIEKEEDDFIIRVNDEGKGIPKEEQRKIFQMFYKGTSNIKEGFGLGLFLIKNIIEQHHGSIKIKSKENKGTTVEVKLPIAKL